MQTTMLPLSLRVAGGAAVASLVGACASPKPTLHTLSARPGAADTSRFQCVFRLSNVRVPNCLDKPQIVLRTSNSKVVALEQQCWAAPFGPELRDALLASLMTTLSAMDVESVTAPADVPLYRIGAGIRSHDARPGQGVTTLMMWRVLCDAVAQDVSTVMPTYQTMLALPASGPSAIADSEADVNVMVSSTQHLIQQWSQRIAQGVQGLEVPSAVPA